MRLYLRREAGLAWCKEIFDLCGCASGNVYRTTATILGPRRVRSRGGDCCVNVYGGAQLSHKVNLALILAVVRTLISSQINQAIFCAGIIVSSAPLNMRLENT